MSSFYSGVFGSASGAWYTDTSNSTLSTAANSNSSFALDSYIKHQMEQIRLMREKIERINAINKARSDVYNIFRFEDAAEFVNV